MARVHDLLGKIADAGLREALAAEVKKLEKGKKFGLVFEEHLPEATPLYDVKVKAGMNVATRIQDNGALFVVKLIKDGVATCISCAGGQEVEYPVDDLVAVAMFGEAIYPYLQKLDQIEHGGGDLWHTLIQADNYHALQLLEYLYAGKVDCIYIDPPYNTGAKDWKYNNDYVDGNDAWRHSKWLSMMEKRLKIAKRLLNPADSVLIVTIDEKEYLHLGMLLEQMFPEARIQMVSSVINPSGVTRGGEFSRTDEYLYFVMLGGAIPTPMSLPSEWLVGQSEKTSKTQDPFWRMLRRSGTHDTRKERPNLFYPIYADLKSGKILRTGESLSIDQDRKLIPCPIGEEIIWPIKKDGSEGCWQLGQAKVRERLAAGHIRSISRNENGWVITYLAEGEIGKIDDGIYVVEGRGDVNGELILKGGTTQQRAFTPGTQWRINTHSARHYGSLILNGILGPRFTFPKSLYAVHDAIRIFCRQQAECAGS